MNPVTVEPTTLRPEDQLILLCARRSCPPNIRLEIEATLTLPLDWAYLLEAVHAQRVLPLVANTLRRLGNSRIPSPALSKLNADAYQNSALNLLKKQELLEILRIFHQHRIPAIPFKGPMLAESIYGDPSLRVFSDFDLLVPTTQIFEAKSLLLARGYQPEFTFNRWQDETFVRSKSQYNLVFYLTTESGMRFHVELHWEILPPFLGIPFTSTLIWQEAAECSYDGVPGYRMSLSNELLSLCFHAWKHAWSPLQWLCDLNEFMGLHRQTIDWESFLARIQSLRLERIIFLTFHIIHSLLGTEFPEEVASHPLGNFRSNAIPPPIRKMIFPDSRTPTTNLEIHRFYLSFLDSWVDRVRYCLHLLVMPTPTDFLEIRLPARLSSLYWLIRPFRLLIKFLLGRQQL